MPRMTDLDRQTVRKQAERFLAEYGFTVPPLPPDDALAARRLEVTPLSFDHVLIKANLPSAEQMKIKPCSILMRGQSLLETVFQPKNRVGANYTK